MARHGRRFPIKPHLAGPIVGPPAPAIVTRPYIASLVRQQAALVRSPKRLHLAPVIVPPEPAIVTRPYVISAALAARFVRRRVLYAKPIVIPAPAIVTVPKVVSAVNLLRFTRGRVRSSPAVPPAQTASPLWTRAYVVLLRRAQYRRPRIQLASPVVNPAVIITISPDVIFQLQKRNTTFSLDPRGTVFELEQRPSTFQV